MKIKVSGKCTGVVDAGKGALLVLINEAGEDGGLLGVRCWGKSAESAKSIKPGDAIDVVGKIETREWNGKYFTNFAALTISASTSEPSDGDADMVPF
jgi:hypothetical protein